MSNLIISQKVNEMKPKPTKAQLIEALLIEAKELHKKEEENKIKLREEAEKRLIEAGLREIAKTDPDGFQVHVNVHNETASIFLNLTSKECRQLIKKISDNKSTYFYEDTAKKKIINSFKPQNPLLNNKEVKKSLKDLALQIFSNVKTIEA